MRGPTRDELLKILPPELRMGSKTTQAYLDIRNKILTGAYTAGQVLVPKHIEEEYHVNNTTTQVLLMRLANEGLVNVFPVKERSWPNNASLNEYRVTDLTTPRRELSMQQYPMLPDLARDEQTITKEILLLKIQYTDAEIAPLLAMAQEEGVVVYRERLRQADKAVVAISDSYIPLWFTEMLPKLEGGDDIYQLMRNVGKIPARCVETVEVVQARSAERVLFELSPDDPAPLLKVQRQTLDQDGVPLAVQFFTVKGDRYRLAYSFPT